MVLFVVPAYENDVASYSFIVRPSGDIEKEFIRQGAARRTFLEVNGLEVIPLFIAPVLLSLSPLLGGKSMLRSLLHAGSAFFLGTLAAISMSGFGLAFAPSGLAMLFAGIAAFKAREKISA